MATDKIRTVAGVLRQAAQRRKASIQQRQEAEKNPASPLLRPSDLRGEYEAARKLYTTLGGNGPRVITEADLKAFKRAADKLGRQFKGGITAQQVIDLSLDDRRQRAQQQITYALPLETRGERMHFITNTGPDSKVARRNVYVEFLTLGSAVSTAEKATTLAKRVAAGPLKFSCDCEDHRYRFKYIATVGGFNIGPPLSYAETGFPKITNPTLTGVACKHVLRVMRVLTGAATQRKLAASIDAMRKTLAAQVQRATNAELEEMARQQQRQAGRQSQKIETTQQRLTRLGRAQQAIVAAVQRERQRVRQAAMTPAQQAQAIRQAANLLALKAITRRQHDAIVARIKKG